MILIDGSSWIHFLRPTGDPVVRARVAAALTAGEACGCPLVLPELTIDNDVWTRAYDLARRARAAGISVPATDILIAACALRHGTEFETADSDFERLAPAGVELLVLRDA